MDAAVAGDVGPARSIASRAESTAELEPRLEGTGVGMAARGRGHGGLRWGACGRGGHQPPAGKEPSLACISSEAISACIHYTKTELPWRPKTAKETTKTAKEMILGGQPPSKIHQE